MERFLAEGKRLATDTDNQKLEAQKIPKDATPNQLEKTFIQRASAIVDLAGNQKRIKMLDDLKRDYIDQMEKLRQGEEAMKQLSMIYIQQQQKEEDWAFAGGLAEGLAGPVAGYMASSQVIEKNRKIQQHNAAMRDTSMRVLSGIPSMISDQTKLREEIKKIEKAQAEANEKIMLSTCDNLPIWEHFKVGKYEIRKADTGVLHISMSIRIEKPFLLDAPENVNAVIDGSLKANVWFENRIVGFVNIPFPLYGIPTNMTEEITLDSMLDKNVAIDGEYTLKILDSHNLWIMEA